MREKHRKNSRKACKLWAIEWFTNFSRFLPTFLTSQCILLTAGKYVYKIIVNSNKNYPPYCSCTWIKNCPMRGTLYCFHLPAILYHCLVPGYCDGVHATWLCCSWRTIFFYAGFFLLFTSSPVAVKKVNVGCGIVSEI